MKMIDTNILIQDHHCYTCDHSYIEHTIGPQFTADENFQNITHIEIGACQEINCTCHQFVENYWVNVLK